MPDSGQEVALGIKPPAAPDIIGPISSLAQMSYWAQQGQLAAASAARQQQETAGLAATLKAKQNAVGAIQGGATPESAITSSGVGIFDPTGATATLGNVKTGNEIAANRAYAKQNPDNPMAITGPEGAAKVSLPAQAAADVTKTQLGNADTHMMLVGKLGTLMAADPSPNGRAQAKALAQQIPGTTPNMISTFEGLPDDQYVAAGRHFQAASMQPENYMGASGQTKYNQGVAEAAASNQKLGPSEVLSQGPGAAAAMRGQPVPPFVPPGEGPPPAPGAPPAVAPVTSPGVPAAGGNSKPVAASPPAGGPNYYGITAQRESGNNPTITNTAAKDPNKAAGGLFQFMPGTWQAVASSHPELGLSPGGYKMGGAEGVRQQFAAMQAFTADNAKQLQAAGIGVNDQNLRMAHFLGAGGAAKFITAGASNPDTPAAPMFPAEAKANPTIFYVGGNTAQPRTLGQVYGMMTKGYSTGLTAFGVNGPSGSGLNVGPGLAAPGANGVPTGATPAPAPQAPTDVLRTAMLADLAAKNKQGQPQEAAPPPPQVPVPNPSPPLPSIGGNVPLGGGAQSVQPSAAAGITPPAAPAPFVPVLQGIGPAKLAEQTAAGSDYGKLREQLDTSASGAKSANTTIDNMLQAADGSWQQGKWAPVAENLRESLQSVAHSIGVATPDLDKPIANYQDFVKISGNLIRQATHDVGSHNGVQEMQAIAKSLPSPETSPDGLRLVLGQLKGLNDFAVAKQQAGGAWRQVNGDSLGPSGQAAGKDFQTVWNDKASPAAFVMHRMMHDNPQVAQQIVDGMKSTPAGLRALKALRDQTQWAADAGLLQ